MFSAPTVHAEGMGIEDLLIPDFPSKNEQIERAKKLTQKPKEQIDMDDLLGPKDNFPFLPDNHRDSGTGKFNSF